MQSYSNRDKLMVSRGDGWVSDEGCTRGPCRGKDALYTDHSGMEICYDVRKSG